MSNWTVVGSTMISAIGTDGDDLLVRFNNGDMWKYIGAAKAKAMLLKAESIGSVFHKHVRDKFESQKLLAD